MKDIHLEIEDNFYLKAVKKAQKSGFEDIQKYIIDILRHRVYTNYRGGRPKEKSFEEEFEDKFSKPTKDTPKITRWAKKYGI